MSKALLGLNSKRANRNEFGTDVLPHSLKYNVAMSDETWRPSRSVRCLAIHHISDDHAER